jgi:hypothetical protein
MESTTRDSVLEDRRERAAKELLRLFPHGDMWRTTAYDAACAVLAAADDQTLAVDAVRPGLAGEQTVADEVLCELRRARGKFGPMASPHEAYAVILEEVDEFWDAVKTKGCPPEFARAELIQVAAMAMRAVLDCYYDEHAHSGAPGATT